MFKSTHFLKKCNNINLIIPYLHDLPKILICGA